MKILLLLALATPTMQPQTSPIKIEQQTAGSCSPTVAEVAGNVSITCVGLDANQRKIFDKLPNLIEQILRKQVDRDRLMAKLDEILRGQSKVAKQLAGLTEKNVPRTLDSADKAHIQAALAKYPGTTFFIASVMQSDESFKFGVMLKELLEVSGWRLVDSALGRQMIAGAPVSGVLVKVRTETPAALALLNALNQRKISVVGQLDPSLKDDDIKITVTPR